MTPEDAFMQAIRENPDDDTPRLVYADWLDEHGQPERAEFIRVQCEAAILTLGDPRRQRLETRGRKLLGRHAAAWLGKLNGSLRQRVFRRGFLEQVRIDGRPFLAHIDALFRLGPIREVTLERAATHIEQVTASPYLLGLEVLHLSSNGIGDAGVQILAASPNVARLTSLGIASNEIGVPGAQALGSSPYLGGLKVLNLSGNQLGDAGVRVLAASSNLARLTQFCLGYNQIGEEGLLALAASPQLNAITSLNLVGNRIDRRRRGAKALRARFGDRVGY
jgi:uncharacterized protein (TIGR02996 family)